MRWLASSRASGRGKFKKKWRIFRRSIFILIMIVITIITVIYVYYCSRFRVLEFRVRVVQGSRCRAQGLGSGGLRV